MTNLRLREAAVPDTWESQWPSLICSLPGLVLLALSQTFTPTYSLQNP